MKPAALLKITEAMQEFIDNKKIDEADRNGMKDALSDLVQMYEDDIFQCDSCQRVHGYEDAFPDGVEVLCTHCKLQADSGRRDAISLEKHYNATR